MFESATLTAAPASTRLWSTCAGVTGQALIVGCMLLAPLVSPAVLPNLRSYVTSLEAPGPPPAPPPKGLTTVQPRIAKATRVFCKLCAPAAVPDRVEIVNDDFPPPVNDQGGGVIGGDPSGSGKGVTGGMLSGIIGAIPAPAPPRPAEKAPEPVKPAAAAPIRVRQGGNVVLAAPIFHPDPIYPQIARTARIEGVVVLEGIVGTDGRIHDLKVKSGHPFLVKAAVDAVLQWRYKPGTLNGDLVEVIAPITVTFRLGAR